MLILSRKVGESLIIGDDITITALEISGQQIRVGICAPRDVSVHREEVYERIAIEKLRDSSGPVHDNQIKNTPRGEIAPSRAELRQNL